jgi:WXG100 family type VII secretion target
MSDEIKLDYEVLKNVATRFQEQSNLINQSNQKLQAALTPLQEGGWAGLGADAFFEAMSDGLCPGLQRLSDTLAVAGQDTAQISSHFREAEQAGAAGLQADAQTPGGGGSPSGGGGQPQTGSETGGKPLAEEDQSGNPTSAQQKLRYQSIGGAGAADGNEAMAGNGTINQDSAGSVAGVSEQAEQGGNWSATAGVATAGTIAAGVLQALKNRRKREE